MKLIIVPLLFLFVFAAISQLGFGSMATSADAVLNTGNGHGNSGYPSWYDENGHELCDENMSAVGEAGNLTWVTIGYPIQLQDYVWKWQNSTGSYTAFNTPNNENVKPTVSTQFNWSGSLGLIGMVLVVMGLATLAGIRFLGIGEGDFSVSTLVKGSAYLTLWGILSVLGYALIVQVPMSFGVAFYFFLTFLYTLGMINQFGSPGSDD